MSLVRRIFERVQREGGDLLGQIAHASGGQAKDEGVQRDDRDGLTDNDSGKLIARLEQEKDAAKDRPASSYFENKARIEREGPKVRPRQPGHDRER